MPYANTHFQYRMLGHFGSPTNTLDNWSTGLRLGIVGANVPSASDLTAFLTTIKTAAQTYHASSDVRAGLTCYLDRLTIAEIGTDGKYPSKEAKTIEYLYPSSVGGAGTITNPWSTAAVTSLRTSAQRGYASNGRFYYPHCAPQIDGATGRIGLTYRDAQLTATNVYFKAINAACATHLGTNTGICVMSTKGAGLSLRVTKLREDTRLDSQERRENKQPPNWAEQTIWP